MLITKIKASPITNLTDARYFAAREVDWIGFDFRVGSETYIAPAMMSAIREWVGGVQCIGEFELETALEIQALIQDLQLDAIQMGMLSSLETLVALQTSVPVFKEIVIDFDTSPSALHAQLALFQPWVAAFVLDFQKNGIEWEALQQGIPFPLQQLQAITNDFRVLLHINLQPKVLKNILEMLQLYGLCVKGGEEEKTGFKSFEEMDDIFEILEL